MLSYWDFRWTGSYFSNRHLSLFVSFRVSFFVLEVVCSVLVPLYQSVRLLFLLATNTHRPKISIKTMYNRRLSDSVHITCDTMCRISPLTNPNPASLHLKWNQSHLRMLFESQNGTLTVCMDHFLDDSRNGLSHELYFPAVHLYHRRSELIWRISSLPNFAIMTGVIDKCSRNNWPSHQLTNIARTSFGVFPSTLIPLTSMTSSPTWIRPLRSAAPPCIILAMIIFPVTSSVLIVAPCKEMFIVFNYYLTIVLQVHLVDVQCLYQEYWYDSNIYKRWVCTYSEPIWRIAWVLNDKLNYQIGNSILC